MVESTFESNVIPRLLKYLTVFMSSHELSTTVKLMFFKGGDIVLKTQNFDPTKNWIDKMQLSEIFTDKRYGLYN